jgi:hypothetical protein
LERDASRVSFSLPNFVEWPDRSDLFFMLPKSKIQSNPFTFVRGLFGRTKSTKDDLKVEQRKADEEVLDRGASVSLALAECLASQAVAENDPVKASTALGAVREARECVKARKEVTGGGMGGGTTVATQAGVTVRIEHSGLPVSDDFHDYKPTNEPGISVQTGSPKTEQ